MTSSKISNPNLLKFLPQNRQNVNRSGAKVNDRSINDTEADFNYADNQKLSDTPQHKKAKANLDETEANSEFELGEEESERQNLVSTIQFIEPHKDLTQSALIVVFVLSHYELFEQMFEVTRNDDSAIVSITKCINILSCVLHEPTKFPRTIFDDIQYFFGNMQLLGISMGPVTKVKSIPTLKMNIETQLAKEDVENMIFRIDYPKLNLPNTIDVASPIMQLLPEGSETIYRQFKLIWALCLRNNVLYPAIVEEDGEIAALYKSELFTRFGSLQSCILSGSTVLFACYSSSTSKRPMLVPAS